MIAIITGDIIKSRTIAVEQWLPVLEDVLGKFGIREKDWEVFRGDSFQLEVAPENVVKTAIYLKTAIKAIGLDLRIGIGIGNKNFVGDTIKESNGEAFILAGEAFEALKKRTLSIKTRSEKTNLQINRIFDLLMLIVEKWNVNISETIRLALDFPDLNQTALAEKMNKKQSQISRELTKSGFDEVFKAVDLCQQIIKEDAAIYA